MRRLWKSGRTGHVELSPEPDHVFAGRNFYHSREGSTHGVGASKAADFSNLLQSHVRAVNHLLCGFNPHAIDKLAGIHLYFPETYAREMPRAHPEAVC